MAEDDIETLKREYDDFLTTDDRFKDKYAEALGSMDAENPRLVINMNDLRESEKFAE